MADQRCGPELETLPWGSVKDRVNFPENLQIEARRSSPGEFVMQTLFAEFTVLADKKIDQVLQNYVSTGIGVYKIIFTSCKLFSAPESHNRTGPHGILHVAFYWI